MRRRGGDIALVVLLCLALPGMTRAGDAARPDDSSWLGRIEWKLEYWRHQQFVASRNKNTVPLTAFVTDGCSGGMSTAWRKATVTFPSLADRHGENPPWEACCVAHDRIYHTGGPVDGDAKASFEARRLADEELRQCVRKVAMDRQEALAAEYGLEPDQVRLLYRVLSNIMHRTVRLGGIPCTRLPWRWGFGWPLCE